MFSCYTRIDESFARGSLNIDEFALFNQLPDFEKKHSSPILREQKLWFVTKNDFPYVGVVHQYLIISKRHTTKATNLSPKEWSEFGIMLKWLSKHLKVKGYSLFIRSGDMKLTGGSLDHIHFQLLVGGPKPKNWQPADSIPLTLGYKKKVKK